MLEKEIENKLVVETKNRRGIALKFISPSFAGMPDRIVLLPKGKIAFIELKRKGENPRALQISRHKMLKKLGFKVYVLDSTNHIKEILNEIHTT